MEKRYQVFISSTFTDLEEERMEVMQAILEHNCMPAGMELFPAANESQMNFIKKLISECDYYVLIVGGRYGSVNPEGIGYTEAEYDYAISIGKPTIAFLHRDPSKIEVGKSESTDAGRAQLHAFREKVSGKLCKHWASTAELGAVVSRGLNNLIKTDPAIGWVRGDTAASEQLTRENLALRQRVDSLQAELASSKNSPPSGSNALAQGNERLVLTYSYKVSDDSMFMDYEFYKGEVETTWNGVFRAVAPLMINETNEHVLHRAISTVISHGVYERHDAEFPDHTVGEIRLEEQDFQTVKVQFKALGLITQSQKNRKVGDTQTYWKLTPLGDQLMTQLIAVPRTPGSDKRSE